MPVVFGRLTSAVTEKSRHIAVVDGEGISRTWKPFYVHQWLDVKSSSESWYVKCAGQASSNLVSDRSEAQIVEINTAEEELRVRLCGNGEYETVCIRSSSDALSRCVVGLPTLNGFRSIYPAL
jgi:hypothetical protein